MYGKQYTILIMKKQNAITVKQEVVPMTAESLIAQAIDKNIDVASMEKLLEMRRTMKQEWAQQQFDRSMAAFQAEMPTIEKKKQGYNYKYADLTAIVEQTREYLAKNGFSYSFDTDETERGLIIYCIIKHVDGHSEKSKAFIDKETTTKMNSSQQSGSVMTYGKRYAFVNALGILTGDEDTDAATPKVTNPPPLKPAEMREQQEIQTIQKEAPSNTEGESPATDVEKRQVVALIKAKKVTMPFTEVNSLTHSKAEQILAAN